MENPPSLIAAPPSDQFADLLPLALKNAYKTIPPELHHLSDQQLKKICYPDFHIDRAGRKRQECHFDIDDRLRHSLWLEFELSIAQNRPMYPPAIYSKIVKESNFYDVILKNPHRVAWITHPPGNYTVDIETLLSRTTERLFEMVEIPIRDRICRCHHHCVCKPLGVLPRAITPEMCACHKECICPEVINTKAMEILLKVRDSLELRAKGSVPQVIRQTSQNITMQLHGKTPEQKMLQQPQTLEELEKELELLRSKKLSLTGSTAQETITTQVIAPAPEVVD